MYVLAGTYSVSSLPPHSPLLLCVIRPRVLIVLKMCRGFKIKIKYNKWQKTACIRQYGCQLVMTTQLHMSCHSHNGKKEKKIMFLLGLAGDC